MPSSRASNPTRNGHDSSMKLLEGVILKISRRLGISSQFAWEGGWSFGIKAANAGFSFMVTILLARWLGAVGYGEYAFAFALVTLLTTPAQSGLPNLIVRETARGIAQNSPDLVAGVWRWSGRLVGWLSLLMVILAGPALLFWRGGLGSSQGQTLVWALALVPLISLGNLRGAALRGLKKVVIGQLPEFIIRPVLFLLLLAGLGLFMGRGVSAPLAMALQVLSSLIAFGAGAWMLWRSTPLDVRTAEPSSNGKAWLASSLMFALIASFQLINGQASTLILGFLAPIEQVGIFRVAVQVASLASFGLFAVNMVVAPRFADLYTRGKMDRLQHLVTNSARFVLVINLVLVGLFILAGRSFFGLVFGVEFGDSYPLLMILLTGQIVNSLAGSVGMLLAMTGFEKDVVRYQGVAALINIVLCLVIIPPLGAIGAAASSAITLASWNVSLLFVVQRRIGIKSSAL